MLNLNQKKWSHRITRPKHESDTGERIIYGQTVIGGATYIEAARPTQSRTVTSCCLSLEFAGL
jgi:hypothetical protein